ncbi:hypothetical protein FB451DRAFT_1219472 [Mycena latifolia]|nr:hypothetical protein FB451DRAFT_1219472 [Mycena latifolia]
MSERPLPFGWIREVDSNTGHPFYVDTKATPPRSIWVHPLEDEQYLREHPEAREKARPELDQKPSQTYSAPATPPVASSSDRASYAASSGHKPEKRGFLTKLKEKAVGTKEEREMEKRHKAEEKRQMLELRERRHQERLAAQAAMYQEQQRQQMYAQQYQPQYAPQQQYAPYGGGYAAPAQQRSGFGGGGMAMPLLGGLAGGLLLGEVLGGDGFGGDGGDGGGFGGDDGGGDF